MTTLRKKNIGRASAVLLLFVGLMGLLVLPAATTGAQDDPPVKDKPPRANVTAEEAISAELAAVAFVGNEEHEPNNSVNDANYAWPLYGWKVSGAIDYVGDVDFFEFCVYDYDGAGGLSVVAAVNAQAVGSNLDSVMTISGDNGTATNDDSRGLDSYLEYGIDGCASFKIEDYDNAHGGVDHWYELYIWVADAMNGEEPNNTMAKATGVAYGQTQTDLHIDRDGDVDWFKFDGQKGDVAEINVVTTGIHSTLETQVTLYNGNKALDTCGPSDWTQGTNCYLTAILPKTGTYHIKVTDAHNKGGTDKRYWLDVGFIEPCEPNDTIATACPIEYGKTVRGLQTTADGSDYYKFYVDSNSGFEMLFLGPEYMEVYDSDGVTVLADTYQGLNEVRLEVHPGWHFVKVYQDAYEDTLFPIGVYDLTVGAPWLMGLSSNGRVGDLAYQKSDILAYYEASDSYVLFFDGSDVGVSANLAGFELVPERDTDRNETISAVLMTFSSATNIPGLGRVAAQDIVQFRPSRLGDSTAGYFEMVLDGSDIGLTSSAEAIDALTFPTGVDFRLYDLLSFSTTGKATITADNGNLSVQDDDAVACELQQGGWNTRATCYVEHSFTEVGLPSQADVAGLWQSIPGWGELTHIFLTSSTIMKLDGVQYKPNDIAHCTFFYYGSCEEWLPKYWTGDSHGLKGKKIDGLDASLSGWGY